MDELRRQVHVITRFTHSFLAAHPSLDQSPEYGAYRELAIAIYRSLPRRNVTAEQVDEMRRAAARLVLAQAAT